MTVNEREQILVELRRLLDEQMEVLRMDLTPEMLLEYRYRQEKIGELVERALSRDDG
jgi:hypothetical protein